MVTLLPGSPPPPNDPPAPMAQTTVMLFYSTDPTNQSQSAFVVVPLKVVSIDASIGREAAVITLPAIPPKNNAGNLSYYRPFAFELDIGIITETWVLHGYCRDLEMAPFPTITQMQEAARIANTQTISSITQATQAVTLNRAVGVTVDMGPGQGDNGSGAAGTSNVEHIIGLFQNLQIHREGGQMYWEWTLNIAVADWSRANFYP